MHVVNSRALISCVIKYLFSSYSFVINYFEVFEGVKGRYNTIPFPTRQPPPPHPRMLHTCLPPSYDLSTCRSIRRPLLF